LEGEGLPARQFRARGETTVPGENPNLSRTGDLLPVDLARRIDLLCDEYERQRRQGLWPDPSAFLPQVPPEARHALRLELAAVEAETGRLAGKASRPEQIAETFGVPVAAVRSWLEELDRNLLDTPGGEPATGTPPVPEAAAPTRSWVAPATGLDLPSRFGEYELLAKLGEGGMGTVYRARHRRLGRDVALKRIRPRDADPSRLAARFEREMRAVGRLDHPHVVEAQHAGEQDGQLFLVMKLLDGLDLARLVRRAGPLRPADACEAVRQAALGLQYIHEQGLVHRDLKPSNLMLTREGVVTILDLGLARLTGPGPDEPELTGKGVTLGTMDYMAPEQQGDPASVTIAADLYGLGCVLFHLLAGRPPFAHHAEALDKLVAHRIEPPPDLRALRPELPAGMVCLVNRLLAKKPADRFAEPRDVAAALGPMAGGADLAALLGTTATRRDAPAAPVPPGSARPRRPRRRWLVAAAAVLGVAAVAGLAALARPRVPRAVDRPETRPAAPLAVRSLRVSHFAIRGETAEPRGDIGVTSFVTRFGDQVRVSAELSEPACFYLLALNPDGKVQLCWPEDERTPPERRPRLDYPSAGQAFDLNDEPRGGLQAFVLVASRQPLPAHAEWRQGLSPLPWQRLPAAAAVWRGDGAALEPVLPGGDHRGTVEGLKGLAPLAETARQLRSAAGVEAVEVLAFPVAPQPGN
jgi:hypothetical protein